MLNTPYVIMCFCTWLALCSQFSIIFDLGSLCCAGCYKLLIAYTSLSHQAMTSGPHPSQQIITRGCGTHSLKLYSPSVPYIDTKAVSYHFWHFLTVCRTFHFSPEKPATIVFCILGTSDRPMANTHSLNLWITMNNTYKYYPLSVSKLLYNSGLCDIMHISGICSIVMHDT